MRYVSELDVGRSSNTFSRKKALLFIFYFKYHMVMVPALADVLVQEWNEPFLSQKYTILFFHCAED